MRKFGRTLGILQNITSLLCDGEGSQRLTILTPSQQSVDSLWKTIEKSSASLGLEWVKVSDTEMRTVDGKLTIEFVFNTSTHTRVLERGISFNELFDAYDEIAEFDKAQWDTLSKLIEVRR